MFKYFFIFLFFIINCCNAFAEPSPFGMEINRSTYKEVKQKYIGRDAGVNKYSQGRMYDIDCSRMDLSGIKSMRAIFNENDKLLALITTFSKNQYDSLMDSLITKYKLISKQDAFVGNKSAKFKDDNTIIELEAPHMSFDLTLSYIHDDFEKMYLNMVKLEEEQKRKSQTNAL